MQLDAVTSATYGDGSVTGMGTGPAQLAATYYNAFNTWSNGTTHDQFINGNYYVTGVNTPPGTGANKLSMPFVNGTNFPYEIIRRPPAGESATSQLGQSREYNMAQIHVLLSDDPADLPGGASDTNNVRLANVTQTTGNTLVTPWGVTIAPANYNAAFGSTASNNYNLYFATASDAIPIPSSCSLAAGNPPVCNTLEWPYAPAAFAGQSATQGLQPAGAPSLWNYTGTATIDICPPASPTPNVVPPGCPPAGTAYYPYYALPMPFLPVVSGALTNYPQTATSDAWNLIDGYLRVEYLNNSGQWVAVTNEWLQLGFARGVTAPTAGLLLTRSIRTRFCCCKSRRIAPRAARWLQNLRNQGVTGHSPWRLPRPVTRRTGSGTQKKCTSWTAGTVPTLLSDLGSGGQWAFGVTPLAPTATTPQSLTQFNWYPINFYDAREGEPRDIDWSTVRRLKTVARPTE